LAVSPPDTPPFFRVPFFPIQNHQIAFFVLVLEISLSKVPLLFSGGIFSMITAPWLRDVFFFGFFSQVFPLSQMVLPLAGVEVSYGGSTSRRTFWGLLLCLCGVGPLCPLTSPPALFTVFRFLDNDSLVISRFPPSPPPSFFFLFSLTLPLFPLYP